MADCQCRSRAQIHGFCRNQSVTLQHHYSRGNALQQIQVMGRENDTRPLLGCTGNEIRSRNLIEGVKTGEWLVQDQDSWPMEHARGQLQLLQIALG